MVEAESVVAFGPSDGLVKIRMDPEAAYELMVIARDLVTAILAAGLEKRLP